MTKRSWITLGVFGACLLVVLAGVAWISATLLELTDREAVARRQAAEEENVRLALWRMDSSIAPIIARESARPYFMYGAFYPAERAYTRMFNEVKPGEPLVPSPLLAESPERILLHFQIDPAGRVSSPQVPEGAALRELARAFAADERIESGLARLESLRGFINRDRMTLALAARREVKAANPDVVSQLAMNMANPPTQASRSSFEWQMRSKSVSQASTYGSNSYSGALEGEDANAIRDAVRDTNADGKEANANPYLGKSAVKANTLVFGNMREGPVTPLWIDDALFLVRRIQIDGAEYLQGCWLDWPSIRDSLLADVRDLVPNARLLPTGARGPSAQGETRRLASLPVHLIAGEIPLPAGESAFPVRLVLGVAWIGVLLAAIAVAVLLFGTIALSERRAAFVSSVTHELRTPLTTFRMYSEMLSEGMISDEEKKRSYLETLKREAVRLSHLVENVLAYARIERGRHTGRIEVLSVRETLDRIRERLSDRASQAGMSLQLAPPSQETLQVTADATALEQILFNLVDNACKYATSASDKRIDVSAEPQGAEVLFRVRDRGPGIPRHEQSSLFSPFSKSAQRAATSAPGVGLGLALSRRLARTMHGELRLEHGPGASFALTLPQG